ncbi:MAG: Holliday junction branch migration protein RuvA [Campylobacteraceae bacterium]|jgi:Holliday junction DNA helicase RuvA|nr:Holliday junction branch migration protein RuvA [Campylobacteraceae bacterium]
MIAAIEGRVVKKEPAFIYLKTLSGVTYKVAVSLHCAAAIQQDVIELNITQIIRDDADLLFGFLNKDEQRMFEQLIKLNGIGTATALAVCSTITPEEFAKALASSDANTFVKVPGIGLKSAKRILVELGEFVLESGLNASSQSQMEARLALEALGFKSDKIKAVLFACKGVDTQELIKEALSKLQ